AKAPLCSSNSYSLGVSPFLSRVSGDAAILDNERGRYQLPGERKHIAQPSTSRRVSLLCSRRSPGGPRGPTADGDRGNRVASLCSSSHGLAHTFIEWIYHSSGRNARGLLSLASSKNH